MRVYGIEISLELEAAVRGRMQQASFQSKDIAKVAEEHLPRDTYPQNKQEVAHRAADRIIQFERKAGNIRLSACALWEWCGAR